MRLIANKQLTGAYGTVPPNQGFDCPDEIQKELIDAGLARKEKPPAILETKVIGPLEVGPIEPFRNMSMPNAEPAPMATASYSMLSKPDDTKPGTIDPSGRKKRGRPAKKPKN